jgi:hypothetical protein
MRSDASLPTMMKTSTARLRHEPHAERGLVPVRPEAGGRSEELIGRGVDDRERRAGAVPPRRERAFDVRVRVGFLVRLRDRDPSCDLRVLAGGQQGRCIRPAPRPQDELGDGQRRFPLVLHGSHASMLRGSTAQALAPTAQITACPTL